jgi:transposase-like protein
MPNLPALIDEARCFQVIRDLRWPRGIRCPHCDSSQVTRQGHDETQPARRRYLCRSSPRRFDDLIGTVFTGHHRPLRVWVPAL